MSIDVVSGPSGGTEAIEAQIGHLLARGPGWVAPFAGAAAVMAPTTRHPMPLYSPTPDAFAYENFLQHTVLIGWRYLILGNGPIAVADVRVGAGSTPRLSQLTRGPLAERLNAAASYAQESYGASSEAFEARVLDIPALDTVAFWLHGTRDVLMPLLEGSAALPSQWEDPEFMGRLYRKAEARAGAGLNLGAAP